MFVNLFHVFRFRFLSVRKDPNTYSSGTSPFTLSVNIIGCMVLCRTFHTAPEQGHGLQFWVECSLTIVFKRGVKNMENKLRPIHTERKRKVSLVFVVFFFCTFNSAFSRCEWTLYGIRTAVDGAGSGGTHPRGTLRAVVELPVFVRPILVVVRRARSTREVHWVPF